jgi:hypothetical protein
VPRIRDADREDFEAMLRLRNLSPSDFDLVAGPTNVADQSGAISPTFTSIIVRSRRTGIERSYVDRGGRSDFVAWVIDVAVDMDAGVFA